MLYRWLHYNVSEDSVHCLYCTQAFLQNQPFTKNAQKSALVSKNGFSFWKNATVRLEKHETSELHKAAVSRINKSTTDIRGIVSSQWKEDEAQSRRCLFIIIDFIKVLCRQGLPLRGHTDENSIFHQLLLLEAKKNKEFANWLLKKKDKFVGHGIQNELVEIMAHNILRGVIKDIASRDFYAIMADETCDKSNSEQLVFCVRSVDQNHEVHEDFLGLHLLDRTTANFIVSVIKDICHVFDLKMENIRAQSYDGAANMAGEKSGVKTQILKENSKALFVYCFNHRLNLAVCDTLRKIQLFKDTLAMINELINLVKKSPKRETMLKNIKLVLFIFHVHFLAIAFI